MNKPYLNGVAVSDSLKLSDAFASLQAIYRQSPLSDDDRASTAFRCRHDEAERADSVGLTEEWVSGCTLMDLAAEAMGAALKTGALSAWTISSDASEVRLDPAIFEWAVLPENGCDVVKKGIFQAGGGYIGSNFNGATLWLKQSEWQVFQRDAIELRRGTAASSAPKPKGRGRPKGSGSLADADQPLIAEMRGLIAGGHAFSATGAAKLVWNKAVGFGTESSKITRLVRGFNKAERK